VDAAAGGFEGEEEAVMRGRVGEGAEFSLDLLAVEIDEHPVVGFEGRAGKSRVGRWCPSCGRKDGNWGLTLFRRGVAGVIVSL